MGLLTGAIAMTTLKDRVYAADASLPAVRLDAYFALTPSVTGLNDKGEPLANATVHPAVWSDYRLSPLDLELCSVVVNDLSLVQLGDLVVSYGASEDPDTAKNFFATDDVRYFSLRFTRAVI